MTSPAILPAGKSGDGNLVPNFPCHRFPRLRFSLSGFELVTGNVLFVPESPFRVSLDKFAFQGAEFNS
jgi:hypothetical protein